MKTRTSLASKALGDRKKFPPEVKTVNMIHVTKRRSKRAVTPTMRLYLPRVEARLRGITAL